MALLEGFFYGLYSGMFTMYLQYQASQKDTDKKRNIVFYSLCVLYVLSVSLFVSDITLVAYSQFLSKQMESALPVVFIQMTLFACCDFVAQFILIYRCWIVWGCNIRVVIFPSILTFAFLVVWLVGGSSIPMTSSYDWLAPPNWGSLMTLSGFALSLTVNALVTGLIVYKIFKVFRQVKASNDQILHVSNGSKLRRTILILIESRTALFATQLVRILVTFIKTDAASRGAFIMVPIHDMFIGITPTIILVQTSMGLSFHDEKSMEEVAIGSLRFASYHSNSIPESGGINIVSQNSRDDNIGVQQSNNINILER